MTRPTPCREANILRVTATATGQPDVDFAADLAVPLLLAQLAQDDARRPSLKIVPSSPDRVENRPRYPLSPLEQG